MTKTVFAERLSAEEFAEWTKDMSPEAREKCRVDQVTSPLFDMWLRFEDAFADRAIDRLDVSDEDAEAVAQRMEKHGASGQAYAYLLRGIRRRRVLRAMCHKAEAIWASSAMRDPLSFEEIHDRYEKLPKGEA